MSLAEPIIAGMIFGLVLSAMIGPVFFALLQTSLQEGFRGGSHLAFGIMLSDAACIALCYFFASRIQPSGDSKVWVGLIGGTILSAFGVYLATRKIQAAEVAKPGRAVHAKYVLRGFLMNTANPAVLLFWLSVVGQVKMREHYEAIHEAAFFVASLITVFSTDLLKSYGAHRLKRILKPALLKAINLIAGMVLVGYGIWMIRKALG